jgi:hypothetical protein
MVGGSVGNRFAEWMDLRISYSDPSGLFRQFLAALLRGLPDDTGLDPGMFLGWSDPFPGEERFSFGPDLAEEAASHLWKMVYAGLLEVTRAEQGRPLLVLTRLGTALLSDDDVESAREERLFVVQPNFEVLADPCSLAAAGEEISPFVELVTADRTFSLRFSRESVRRGIHHGHSIPSCCQALCRHATHEVPENVLDTIQEWAAEYHRVRLRPGLLIQVDTDEQAEMLRHSPVFKLIREEISPRSFWAAMEDRTEIKRRLTGLKMDVDDEPPRVREDDEDLTEIRPVQGLSRLRTREATPECYPVGSFEPAEEVLREILQSYEIVPPGGGAGGPGGGDRSPGSGEPHKIRAAVSEALRTERPLRLTLFQRGGRPPETQIVSPICWGPDRGRFSFYAHQSGGAERLWRLDEILDASLLPEDTPFDM